MARLSIERVHSVIKYRFAREEHLVQESVNTVKHSMPRSTSVAPGVWHEQISLLDRSKETKHEHGQKAFRKDARLRALV